MRCSQPAIEMLTKSVSLKSRMTESGENETLERDGGEKKTDCGEMKLVGG